MLHFYFPHTLYNCVHRVIKLYAFQVQVTTAIIVNEKLHSYWKFFFYARVYKVRFNRLSIQLSIISVWNHQRR